MEKSSQSRYMTKLHKSGNLGSFDYESYDTCKSCLLGKMTKLSFKGTCKWAFRPNTYRCMWSDVHTCQTNGFSQYGYLYLMKYKLEAFEKFKEFRIEVEKQLGKSIKTLKYDRGGEYLIQEFLDYVVDHGIQSQWTPRYTPQHNDVPNLVRHSEVNDG